MNPPEKKRLFWAGIDRMIAWCRANAITEPDVVEAPEPVTYGTCAFYRSGVITIHVPSCAAVGTAGRSWSFPGYTVDRTPYGVLAHELGHHVDGAHGFAGGRFGRYLKVECGEDSLTTYAPNLNEYFAEFFRLFVTNPDLLRLIRPRTFAVLGRQWQVVETRPWDVVLADAPGGRQLNAARRKIERAQKGERK